MSTSVSVGEVKATLSERIRDVERGEPVVITRHGKPVVALVRVEDFEHLERLRRAGSEGGLGSLAGGWADSDELVRILENSSRIGRREVAALE